MVVQSLDSRWRDPLHLRSRRTATDGLQVSWRPLIPESVAMSRPSRTVSAMAAHQSNQFFAVSSYSAEESPDGVSGAILDIVAHSSTGIEVIQGVPLEANIGCDVAWGGDMLFASLDDGSVSAYKADDATIRKGQVHKLANYALDHLSGSSGPPPPPGCWMYSSRVQRLATSTKTPQFVCAENHRFHVWDVTKSDAPLLSSKGSSRPIFACDWSKLSSLVALGGANQGIKVLDLRTPQDNENNGWTTQESWRINDAHLSIINDIRFSPLLPNWIASCSADGIVAVWDLRNNNYPAMKIDAHSGSVTRLSWSPTHAELLCTSSEDCTCRLWSLNAPPHHCVKSFDCPDAAQSCTFIHARAPQVTAVTASGQLLNVVMTKEFMKPLVQHMFQSEEEKEVERFLYSRDIEAAVGSILNLVNQYQSEGQTVQARELLERMKSAGEGTNPQCTFAEELKEVTSFLPPNLPKTLTVKPSGETMKSLGAVGMNIDLAVAVHSGNAKEVSEIISSDVMLKLIGTIHARLMLSLTRLLMGYSFVKAIDIALAYATAVLDPKKNTFEKDVAPIALLLLQPTVLDHKPDGLNMALRNASYVIAHLKYMKSVQRASYVPHPSAQIVKKWRSQRGHNIGVFSVAPVRLQLNALLYEGCWSEFYSFAAEVSKHIEGQFAAVVVELVNKAAHTPFLKHCKNIAEVGKTEVTLPNLETAAQTASTCYALLGSCSEILSRVRFEAYLKVMSALCGTVETGLAAAQKDAALLKGATLAQWTTQLGTSLDAARTAVTKKPAEAVESFFKEFAAGLLTKFAQ